ncbi:MAG: hypothetical protein EOL95_11590 [Bacteroidia bacterium]|nr:hypothetical protein [Bacteroidia bacterium]
MEIKIKIKRGYYLIWMDNMMYKEFCDYFVKLCMIKKVSEIIIKGVSDEYIDSQINNLAKEMSYELSYKPRLVNMTVRLLYIEKKDDI